MLGILKGKSGIPSFIKVISLTLLLALAMAAQVWASPEAEVIRPADMINDRIGYTLLGFSLSPDATEPTYAEDFSLTAGEATGDIMGDGKEGTLYAVWRQVVTGGSDPDEPPNLPPGSTGTLIRGDDNTYIEVDENGAPMGEWRYDPDEGEWIFDPFIPLTALPQTGDDGIALQWLILMGVAGAGMIATLIQRKQRQGA